MRAIRTFPVTGSRGSLAVTARWPMHSSTVRGAPEDLGAHFGAGLTAREVEYLAQREWALTADDVLWRRTKVGLHLTDLQRESVARHLREMGDKPKPLRQ